MYFGLSRLFFRPYLRLLDARDAAQGIDRSAPVHGHEEARFDEYVEADPELAGVASEEKSLEDLKLRVQAETESLHKRAAEQRSTVVSEARSKGQETVAGASSDAAKTVSDAQQRVESLREEVWTGLIAQKADFLNQIQDKLLA